MTRTGGIAAFLLMLGAALCGPARAAPIAVKGDVLLQADEMDYDVDAHVVTAKGHVEIDNAGRILLADQVSYDQDNDVMTADGHVSLMDEKGNVAFATHVVLKDQMRDGALKSFAALIGKNGRLVAASATRSEGRFTQAFDAAYTPCKICNQPGQRTPVWQVSAKHVVYDQVKHRIVFHDATVEVLGVPVFYTPYLREPDPTVRYATGLLTPDIGNSTTIGYFTRLPIYIAISPSEDATIMPVISTRGGELIEGEYRRRWSDGGMWLQPTIGYNPNGGVSDNQVQTYASLFGSGRLPFDRHWQAGFDAQYTSNDTYLRRYDISQLDRLVNDLFVDGEGARTRFAVTGYFFQGLRSTDSPSVIPLALPLVEFSFIPLTDVLGGQFRFDVNSVTLTRDIGANSQRATAEARLRWPTILPGGQELALQLDVRGDVYHVSDLLYLGKTDRVVTRGIPYAAIDWRWPFISNMGKNRSLIVEPIAQLIYQPYGGNPKGIPNEDAAGFELDPNNVLSFNQMPGYDLVESGPRANVGLHARAIFGEGSIDALLAQTYRVKPDPIFSGDPAERGTASDVIGRVSIRLLPWIDLTDRIEVDRSNGTVRSHEVYLTGIYNRSTVQISYVQLPAELVTLGLGRREEINAQADINFYANWQAFAAIRRDLLAGQMLDTEYGLGYEDECLGIALAYRRKYTSDVDLPPSTSVILRINLKTGDEAIEPFSLFPRDVFAHP